jgi:hypothetical protein
MLIQIGLENNIEGRSLAWALDLPGCFAYGANGAEALLSVPRAVLGYADWIAGHTERSWLAGLGDFDVRLVDTWDCYSINDGYDEVPAGSEVNEINAWFRQDWKPLTEVDVQRGLAMLEWSRADLLASVAGLAPELLNAERPGERWSINGILNHVGGAEWWYLDRLGLAGIPRQQVSKVPAERLATVRARLKQVLPTLVGVELVTGKQGEFWSPRKLLRRALWHELDHIGHILKLLTVKK